MLESTFETLYLLFRSNYYKKTLGGIGSKGNGLSATENYCVEIIHLLNRPTITDFAQYLNLSVPNANYKINSLVKKGYIIKEHSTTDLREQYLCVTDKFLAYYGLNDNATSSLMQRIRQTFSETDIEKLDEMLQRVIVLMQQAEEDNA